MVVAGGGNLEQGFGTAQYGGGLGKSTDYRIFTKYFNQDHLPAPAVRLALTDGMRSHGGFRTDSRLSAKDSLMVAGRLVYRARKRTRPASFPSVTSPGPHNIDIAFFLSGGFLHSAVESCLFGTVGHNSADFLGSLRARRQCSRKIVTRSTLNSSTTSPGAAGKTSFGEAITGIPTPARVETSLFSSIPPDLTMQIFSLFFQDEVALVPDKLYLTIGTKLEHNYLHRA